jgi:hypothetical protein
MVANFNTKTISEKLLTKVKTLPVAINTQIVIMIAGGICNLTVKKKLNSGGYILRYEFPSHSGKGYVD